MKKLYYLPLGMAALALLATGCTAEDPANGLDINQTIYVDPNGGDGNGGSTENPQDPTTRYKMYSMTFNDAVYRFDYNVSGIPVLCEGYTSDYGNCAWRYDIKYSTDAEHPSEISWVTADDVEINYQSYRIVTEQSLKSIEFDGDLMKSATYSCTTYTYLRGYPDILDKQETLPDSSVKFEYDGASHLVKIVVDGENYALNWDDAGNLTEVNSPYYDGTSIIEYSDVVNRYGQWDPTFPMMGFFQCFGWFGAAPTNFPSRIYTTALTHRDSSNRASTPSWYTMDYYLNYDGLIQTVKWSASLNNYVEARIDYMEL